LELRIEAVANLEGRMLKGGFKISDRARRKLATLAATEFDLLNIAFTAAILKPEIYMEPMQEFTFFHNNRAFDCFVAAIPGAFITLFFDEAGNMGLFDFRLTEKFPGFFFQTA